MFFIISKITAFLLSPIFWLLILVIATIVSKKSKNRYATITLLWLLLFGNQAIFNYTTSKWEEKPASTNAISKIAHPIVILGGYARYDSIIGTTTFNQSCDRMLQGLIIANAEIKKPIILSGGAANIYHKQRGESAAIKETLIKIGLTNHQIIVDSISRNTYENSIETKQLFQQNRWPLKAILATSAWHMPRAKSTFEKQGFEIIPLNSDYLTSTEPLAWHQYILPSANTLASWDLLIREWVGFVVYKTKGYN